MGGEIDLVQQQQYADAGVLCGYEAAIEKVDVRHGQHGQDDDDLICIGRDGFLALGVGAVNEARAGLDSLDDAFAGAGSGENYPVAADDPGAAPTRNARQGLARRHFDQQNHSATST